MSLDMGFGNKRTTQTTRLRRENTMDEFRLSELDFKHLLYASAVASCGSVTKAAGTLFVAPPNLSRSVSELEATLGFSLFIRTKKGMVLTPEGQRFISASDKLMEDYKKMIADCRGVQETSFSFSCVPSSLFTNVFLGAASKMPGYRISSKEYGSVEDFFQSVVKERADAGFLIFGTPMKRQLLSYIEERGLIYHHLKDSPLYLICSEDHPLCREERSHSETPDLSKSKLIINTSYYEPLGIRLDPLSYPFPSAASIQRGGGRAANLDMLDAMNDCVLLTCRFHSRILKRNRLAAFTYRPETPIYEYGYVTKAGKKATKGFKNVMECVLDALHQEFQIPL